MCPPKQTKNQTILDIQCGDWTPESFGTYNDDGATFAAFA